MSTQQQQPEHKKFEPLKSNEPYDPQTFPKGRTQKANEQFVCEECVNPYSNKNVKTLSAEETIKPLNYVEYKDLKYKNLTPEQIQIMFFPHNYDHEILGKWDQRYGKYKQQGPQGFDYDREIDKFSPFAANEQQSIIRTKQSVDLRGQSLVTGKYHSSGFQDEQGNFKQSTINKKTKTVQLPSEATQKHNYQQSLVSFENRENNHNNDRPPQTTKSRVMDHQILSNEGQQFTNSLAYTNSIGQRFYNFEEPVYLDQTQENEQGGRLTRQSKGYETCQIQ